MIQGQSAIEYLMTYGWMLLVVAVAGGAIFSITEDQAVKSTRGFAGNDVAVENFGLSEDSLDFVLRNSASEKVNIKSVKITDPETGINTEINPQAEISVGKTTSVKAPGIEQGDSSESLEIEIIYDSEDLKNLSISGTVSGNLEIYNRLSLDNARFNRSTDQLSIDIENTGIDSTNSIHYTVNANNTDYTGSLSNLAPQETTVINITTGQTYSLESIKIDTEGPQFTDTNSNLQCTPTKGLVGYWPFNEEQTQNGWTKDISGQQNNGSLENGVTTDVNGQVGEAYEFKDESYVSLGHFSDGSKNFTWSGWVKTGLSYNPSNLYEMPVIIGTVQGGGNTEDALLGLNNGKLSWYNEMGGENIVSDNIIQDNRYQYIVAKRSVNSTTELFVDGKKVGSGDAGSEGINNNGLELARANWDENNFYKGFLDEIRIYNYSLSHEEIQHLYEIRSKEWAISGCKLVN